MGILVDFVPNHMAADWENPWWRDVLARGQDSEYAAFFDIDWERPAGPARGKVVLPVLGEPYAEALAEGEIGVERTGYGWAARYHEKRFPLRPGTVREGRPPDPADRDALDALLARQNWWLVHWREAGEAVNYRRFFTIADLVGVRVEDPDVFGAVHAGIAPLIEERLVAGVRVDHVDGLHDPGAYLARLHGLDPAGELYVVVEKILARGEALPEGWPVAGTTGYDFLGAVDGLLVDEEGFGTIVSAYGVVTGTEPEWEDLAHATRRAIAERHFAGDLRALTAGLLPVARSLPRGRDLPRYTLRETLLEVTACLPVYRTYVEGSPLSDRDRRAIETAFEEARRRVAATPGRADPPDRAFDVLEDLFTLEAGEGALPAIRRWQQLSGAIMAKGVEDTAFYRYNPLISLNEVGTDPGEGALPPAEFHRFLAERAREWPGSMSATSTHDTKRSEDVRARISALSWIPERWAEKLLAWREWNAEVVERVEGERAPDAAREVSLYQTMIGAWPADPDEEDAFLERLAAYLPKALREAKLHSEWGEPAAGYERAVVEFALRTLDPGRDSPFREDFLGFQREVAALGARLSMAQLALKLAAPGVPDLYRGCEIACLSLVDPDNRRPVDWERREALLEEVAAGPGASRDPGRLDRAKLVLVHAGLGLRRRYPALFGEGEYLPLSIEGPGDAAPEDAALAFARRHGEEWAMAVVARDPSVREWGSSIRLPDGAPGRWRADVGLSGEIVEAVDGLLRLDTVLGDFPASISLPA